MTSTIKASGEVVDLLELIRSFASRRGKRRIFGKIQTRLRRAANGVKGAKPDDDYLGLSYGIRALLRAEGKQVTYRGVTGTFACLHFAAPMGMRMLVVITVEIGALESDVFTRDITDDLIAIKLL